MLQGHTLEFFNTTAELYAGKPPRETVVLSPDCTVESRKLPTKLRATGATTTASMAATTATSSAGTSGAAATGTGGNGNTTNPGPDAGFSDLQEPDSVIDLHMSGQSTITLQCFSVEEENRWISHLQVHTPRPAATGAHLALTQLTWRVSVLCCVVSAAGDRVSWGHVRPPQAWNRPGWQAATTRGVLAPPVLLYSLVRRQEGTPQMCVQQPEQSTPAAAPARDRGPESRFSRPTRGSSDQEGGGRRAVPSGQQEPSRHPM